VDRARGGYAALAFGPMNAAPEQIAATIVSRRGGRGLLLLCDFDGTLCEFDPDPAAVCLPARRRALLNAIAGVGVPVGIVTGRRLVDLATRIGDLHVSYLVGFHGLEIDTPRVSFIHPEVVTARALVRQVADAVARDVEALPGVFLEDKESSISLHYREASPSAQTTAQTLFLRAARPLVNAGALKLLPGSCVIELLPNIAWDKGAAVKWIREDHEREAGPVSAVYMGDDVTDEHAFAALGPGDTGVGSSERVSLAEFDVDGPVGIEAVLRALCSRLS
jgi:trehalose-phosphatase